MTHLCLIAPIGLHPRFVRVRPLRFRHEAGAIIARTEGFIERLSRAEASARLRAIDHDIHAHERACRHASAIQARADRHDLDVALRELCALQSKALARPTGRPSECEAPRGA
jgi:hypothetical protein